MRIFRPIQKSASVEVDDLKEFLEPIFKQKSLGYVVFYCNSSHVFASLTQRDLTINFPENLWGARKNQVGITLLRYSIELLKETAISTNVVTHQITTNIEGLSVEAVSGFLKEIFGTITPERPLNIRCTVI